MPSLDRLSDAQLRLAFHQASGWAYWGRRVVPEGGSYLAAVPERQTYLDAVVAELRRRGHRI